MYHYLPLYNFFSVSIFYYLWLKLIIGSSYGLAFIAYIGEVLYCQWWRFYNSIVIKTT